MRFTRGEIYHIYIRGVEGRNIFLHKRDYERFLLGLKEFNTSQSIELRRIKNADRRCPQKGGGNNKKLVSLLSYILMKNHVHLLIYCHHEKDLSKFLTKIFMGYTKYFNEKYQRKGVLFQGRSKSKHIQSGAQMEVIIRYIPLNALDYKFPEWREGGVKNKQVAKKALLDYPWSGLQEILGKKDYGIIDKELIKDFIPDANEFFASLINWSIREFEEEQDILME